MSDAAPQTDAPNLTVSHLFGEMTWVMSQSPLHKMLPIQSLELLVMPAILLQQLYVFREGDKPIGFATWAYCNAASEKKLNKGILDPNANFQPNDWKSGDQCWLLDFVSPFANAENKHREIMMADLISGPLRGKAFKMHQTDPKTGERKIVEVGADAGEQLKAAVLKAAADENGNATRH